MRGEPAQREQGVTEELVPLQTKIALGGVSAEEMQRGRHRLRAGVGHRQGALHSNEQAQEVCAAIRKVGGRTVRPGRGRGATTVQYGGRRNAANADELLEARRGRRADRRRLADGRRLPAPSWPPPRNKRSITCKSEPDIYGEKTLCILLQLDGFRLGAAGGLRQSHCAAPNAVFRQTVRKRPYTTIGVPGGMNVGLPDG